MLARALVLAALVLGSAACAPPSSAGPRQTVDGVLLDVVSPSLQQVTSFTLRADDGRELAFVTAPEFNQGVAHVMTPGHMRQHMALAEPIRVTYRDDAGKLVALSAVDAASS